jgi:DNA-binding beta-propeller fold protein YncE
VAVLLIATGTALAATGALTQPGGTAGCVSDTGSGPCADGHGLAGAYDVAVSADRKNVYVASYNNNGVAVLNRNTTTGAVSQPGGSGGCISQIGAGPCADGHALSGVQSVAVSPDGKNVYAATYSDAVVRLDRNTTTGAVTQPAGAAGCISQTGAGPCADGHGLKNPVSVTVSPDGKSVYVASPGGDDVARFSRNTATGALSQPAGTAGCVSETGTGPCADGHALSNPVDLVVSPDNKSVYVTSPLISALVRFNRSTTTGALTQPAGTAGCISMDGSGGECALAPGPYGYEGVRTVAVSQDGTSVYLTAGNGVAHLTRNTTSGAVTQSAGPAGCIVQDAAASFIPCADAHGLEGPTSVAVSADGRSVYVASAGSNGVANLDRNTTTGALTQPAGTAGCVNETGSDSCANGHGLKNPTSVGVSADGKSVYLASFVSDAVARFNRAP